MTTHGQPNIDLLTFLWLPNNSKDGSTFPVELFLLYIALFLLRGNYWFFSHTINTCDECKNVNFKMIAILLTREDVSVWLINRGSWEDAFYRLNRGVKAIPIKINPQHSQFSKKQGAL